MSETFYIDLDNSRFFLHKKNGNYRFFCPEMKKQYGPTFIGSEINEELLKTKWYPLKKHTHEDYIKELLAFSKPMVHTGQPFPVIKKGKMEKEGDDDPNRNLPLSQDLLSHSRQEAKKLEDIYGVGSLGPLFEYYPDITSLLSEFLKGRDKITLIRLLPKELFRTNFFRQLYTSTNVIDYELFNEEVIEKKTPEQKKPEEEPINIRKKEVKHLLVHFPDSIEGVEKFLEENDRPLRGFDSLETIEFNFRDFKRSFWRRKIPQDLENSLTTFVYQFLKNKYVKKVSINLDVYEVSQYVPHKWNCSILKVNHWEGLLPNSVEHIDCVSLNTFSDLSNIKILHILELDSAMVPLLKNLKNLTIGRETPVNIKQLASLEILNCIDISIDKIPPNLSLLETDELTGTETETETDPDTIYPRSLSSMIINDTDFLVVPSWLENLSITSPIFIHSDVENMLKRFTNIKSLSIYTDIGTSIYISGDEKERLKSHPLFFPNTLDELTIGDSYLLKHIVVGNNLRSFSFLTTGDRIEDDFGTVVRFIKSASVDPYTFQEVPLMIQEITILFDAYEVRKYRSVEVYFKKLVRDHATNLLLAVDEVLNGLDIRVYIDFTGDPTGKSRIRVEKRE